MANYRTGQVLDDLGIEKSLFKRNVITTAFEAGPPQANVDIAVDADFLFELSGTNAVSLTAAVHAEGGGVRLLTAGAANDQAIISPHADTQQSAVNVTDWSTDDEVAMAVRITTGSAVTGYLVHAGLGLTAAMDETTDADQAKFTFDTGNSDANWMANWSIGGTDSEIDTGIAVTADTDYLLLIVIDADRVARFYIDDTNADGDDLRLVATSGALTTAKDLIPFVGVQALTGAARHVEVRRIALAKQFND